MQDQFRILFDLHTHTRFSTLRGWSHAKGSVHDNAQSAATKHMGVAISNHGPAHRIYGVSASAMTRIKQDIDAENARFSAKMVLCGCECNLLSFAGNTDASLLPFVPDVLLMGYHKGASCFKQGGPSFFMRTALTKGKCSARMTDAVIAALRREPFDVLTHPGEYIPVDLSAVAEAAAALGVAMELNEKHPMTPEQVHICLEKGAFFVISSDAHRPEKIGEYPRCKNVIKSAGIPLDRVVNSASYRFDGGLRVDKLAGFAQNIRNGFPQFSTIQNE